MSFLPGKRLVLLGIIVILLAAIPLTLYLVQKQQEIRSRAVPSTTLSFAPPSSQNSPLIKTVGETFTLDVMMNPGTNEVVWAELAINYDPAKLATAEAALAPTNALPGVVKGPTYTSGTTKITFSRMGAQEVGGITTTTKIATLTLKALAQTQTPIQITFDNQTLIRSTRGRDPGDLNVLSSTTPAWIAIAQAAGTPTPSPTESVTPTSTPVPTTTGAPTPTSSPVPTGGVTPTSTPVPTATSTPTPTLIAAPSIPPPGPEDKIIGAGIAGIIITIIGGLLLFVL